MREEIQALSLAAKVSLVVIWFVGITAAVYWAVGPYVQLWFFAYGVPSALIHCYMRAPQIKPIWVPFWFIGIMIGWMLAAASLALVVFVSLYALGLIPPT